MKVIELIAYLETLDPNLTVLERICSDYSLMDLDSWVVKRAHPRNGQDSFTAFDVDDKSSFKKFSPTENTKNYLIFLGN